MFTLAHLSDPHIGPMPDLRLSQLLSKRFFGYTNWKRKRHKVHSDEILASLVRDIKKQKIDHVALTGDLVNISLPMEFSRAQNWLKAFGKPDWISVIPGNHDTYVPQPWDEGLGLWQDYMTSDKAGATYLHAQHTPFPYVRIRGKIALIGLSSGEVFPPLLARGALGQSQIESAKHVLEKLGKNGFYRIVMIHHPPLPGQNSWRKALKERQQFTDVLKDVGAELVLHGHNHQDMHQTLETTTGTAHIFGVPSASATGYDGKPAARYHLYNIAKGNNGWKLSVIKRAVDPETGAFKTLKDDTL